MGVGPSRLSENIQLYLGSIRDATDKKKLSGAEITHLVSILSEKQSSSLDKSKNDKFTEPLSTTRCKRFLITEEDQKQTNISKYFSMTSEFIHEGLWIDNGNLLGKKKDFEKGFKIILSTLYDGKITLGNNLDSISLHNNRFILAYST